jgi:hypothetical protein
MRTAAVFIRLKFSAQRGTLQWRLVMHERHEVVGKFATSVFTAGNIRGHVKAEESDMRDCLSRHRLCRIKRDDKIVATPVL